MMNAAKRKIEQKSQIIQSMIAIKTECSFLYVGF